MSEWQMPAKAMSMRTSSGRRLRRSRLLASKGAVAFAADRAVTVVVTGDYNRTRADIVPETAEDRRK
jgi:hypothetical protein